MKKNPTILNLENNEGVIFSEVHLGSLLYNEELFKKLEKIYFKIEFKSGEFDEIIYKGPTPFYLSLVRIEKNSYDTSCYCSPENYDKVKIFLNSLLKKQKNDNNNNTGT